MFEEKIRTILYNGKEIKCKVELDKVMLGIISIPLFIIPILFILFANFFIGIVMCIITSIGLIISNGAGLYNAEPIIEDQK